MCNSCEASRAQLKDLIARFESLAHDETDPVLAQHLRQALADLQALSPSGECRTCAGDVTWVDEPASSGH